MELMIQLAIIFVGKQFMMSIVEYYLPMFWKLYNSFKLATSGKNQNSMYKTRTPQWVKDFKLAEWGHQGLFYEYLEMGKLIFNCYWQPMCIKHFFAAATLRQWGAGNVYLLVLSS